MAKPTRHRPSYSPAPGNYTSSSAAVTITTPTPSAIIRYTVDGTTPSQTNGFTYTGAVTVGANETLAAYAYEAGYTTAPCDLNMSYAHDNEGKVTAVTYPTDAQAGVTPQYNYQYDVMSRPSGMSDQNAATVVSGVLYGAANELLSMNYDGGTETRNYNAMFQLTNISALRQNIAHYAAVRFAELADFVGGMDFGI